MTRASNRYGCNTLRFNRAIIIFYSTFFGAIALSYPPHPLRVRVRATVKFSAAFFHDESSSKNKQTNKKFHIKKIQTNNRTKMKDSLEP